MQKEFVRGGIMTCENLLEKKNIGNVQEGKGTWALDSMLLVNGCVGLTWCRWVATWLVFGVFSFFLKQNSKCSPPRPN